MSEEERRALGPEGTRRGVEGLDINEGHRGGGVREKLHEVKEVCNNSVPGLKCPVLCSP